MSLWTRRDMYRWTLWLAGRIQNSSRTLRKRRLDGRRIQELESRLLLSAIVTTDLPDYSPGSIAHFTATSDGNPVDDFSPGESVQFQVERTDGVSSSPPGNLPWVVTDGVGGFEPYLGDNQIWNYPDTDGTVNGVIGTTWFVDPQYGGASLRLTAVGLFSGVVATTDFTDAVPATLSSISVTSQITSPVYGTASSSPFSVTTNRLSSGQETATLSLDGPLPAGLTATLIPSTLTFGPGTANNSPGATLFLATSTTTPAGTYTFTVTATGANSVTSSPITFTIARKTVSPSIVANSRVYDATTVATVSAQSLAGIIPADVGQVDFVASSIAFANKNVAVNKLVTASGIALSGTAASNYVLSTTSATSLASISRLAVTGMYSVADKVYDGSTAALITSRDLLAVPAADHAGISLVGGSAVFNSRNAGSGVSVTGSGFTLSGTEVANYTLAAVANPTANIERRVVVGTIAAVSRVYDGTTTATFVSAVAGVLAGDDVSIGASNAQFADRRVGTWTVSADLALAGADAGNYVVNATASDTATISTKSLVGTIAADDRVYDGTTTATAIGGLSGVVFGDDVSVSVSNATFADRSVGTWTMSADLALTGTDAGNYIVNSTASDTATISAKSLLGTISADDRVYDGTTDATAIGELSGVVLGDDVSVTASNATFADRSVGTWTVSADLALTGADAGNYVVNATASNTATISAKSLVSTIAADDRVYDGATTATAIGGLSGVVFGDDVSVSVSNATFADRSVGTWTVSADLALTGADAGNYIVNATASDTATISAKPLVGTIDADDRVYDGTTTATAIGELSGVVLGDDVSVSVSNATFADRSVGTWTVSADLALTGADAGNYVVNATASDTATISAKSLVGAISANDKVYDGTNIATASATLIGVVIGDDVSVVLSSPQFASSAVGTWQVSANLSLVGSDTSNYTVNGVAFDLATITPLGVTALVGTISAQDKIYDGSTVATVVGSVSGILNGDQVDLVVSNPHFVDPGVGIQSVVATLSLTGPNAANYTVNTTAQTTARILPAVLTVSANNATRQYSDPNPALSVTISGFVGGETLVTSGVHGYPVVTTSATRSTLPGNAVIYTAPGSLSATNYVFMFLNGQLEIIPEDARVRYLGTIEKLTASASQSSTTVRLSARVSDIANFPRSADYDRFAGDVHNATVTFVDRETNQVIASNVPVRTLTDRTNGVATFDWLFNLGSAQSRTVRVGVIVSGAYARNQSADDILVTVSKPVAHSIHGGGSFASEVAAGIYAANPGSRVDFGIGVKFGPGVSNLDGGVTVVFRSGAKVYEIRSTTLTLLKLTSSDDDESRARLVSGAILVDITDPLHPVTVADIGLQLQLKLGDDDCEDSVRISLTDANGTLLFGDRMSEGRSVEIRR